MGQAHQSGPANCTHRCKQFSRSPRASLTISANTGITTQSLGLPLAANGVAEIAAVVGLDGGAAAGVAVVVAASPSLLPVAAGTEAISIVAVYGAQKK